MVESDQTRAWFFMELSEELRVYVTNIKMITPDRLVVHVFLPPCTLITRQAGQLQTSDRSEKIIH